MKGYLILEDGTVWAGQAFGATGKMAGEVVFNTGMTGYQELLTDPSYCGHIVVMTYPLIGNYGINAEDFESRQPFVRGFVVREWAAVPVNWRSRETIDAYLARTGVVGLAGLDTRALTRRLRRHGSMRGVIYTGLETEVETLVAEARQVPEISGQSLVDEVSTPETYCLAGNGPRVVILDLGLKNSIAHFFQAQGCEVIVVPARTGAAAIFELNPAGIVLSNGPGDPLDALYVVETVRRLLGKSPVFGIGLGHQLMGLAVGAKTQKLPFGHRGGNYPVKDLANGRVYITSQNHGFVIDPATLPAQAVVSHCNLNDGSVEGLTYPGIPAFSVQYHPETGQGVTDPGNPLYSFLKMIEHFVRGA
ncbi:MAG: carbamoyl phosphate synthase small subunit [Heliobacteriaceae bacterium]|nr:carbamoyl phosphate synthase small subunit [Heliobacteriaceae bacterium]MDD4587459.1 carbamoyl phosphate synthase small subunit [Heliobacteriaceae bacterium]